MLFRSPPPCSLHSTPVLSSNKANQHLALIHIRNYKQTTIIQMAYDSPSPADTAELLAPSLCLNPDAIEDLAPVQPSAANLLPDSFPTLSWSEQSSADHRAAKAEKRLCYRHRPDLRSKRAADEIQLDQLQQVNKHIRLAPSFSSSFHCYVVIPMYIYRQHPAAHQ